MLVGGRSCASSRCVGLVVGKRGPSEGVVVPMHLTLHQQDPLQFLIFLFSKIILSTRPFLFVFSFMSSPLGYPVGYLWRHLFVANIRYGSFQSYLWTTLIVVYDVDSTHMATVTSKMSKITLFFCFQGDFSIEGGFHDHFTYSLLFCDEPVPRNHSSSSSESSM